MTQPEPPDQLGFLKSIVESVKDMNTIPRFVVVILVLMIFAFLFNVAIPAEFVNFFYFALVGGLFLYLFWEWQQHKARESERRDQREAKKLELDQEYWLRHLDHKYDDRKHEREHETPKPPPAPVKTASPQELKIDYLDYLLAQVSELSLLGIDPKAAADAKDASLNLGQVYTALLTADGDDMEKMQRMDQAGRQPQRISALAQLDRHGRFVLLGDPGSGKSTFVNFVAMCLAGEALNLDAANLNLLTAPLPNDEGEDGEERQPWSQGTLLPLRVILPPEGCQRRANLPASVIYGSLSRTNWPKPI